MVQLFTDLIELQSRRKEELWLASFDIEKCYDTLPWWGLFGMMDAAGIQQSLVACFADFCKRLRRRFRYGQREGAPWQAANGAAKGCPASPDELNILLEPFHRWARAQGLGCTLLV